MGLYERLKKEIHGSTPSDIPPITKWVKGVEKTGRIAGWQIIALLLYDLERDGGRTDEENRRFVSELANVILFIGRHSPMIEPRDHLSLEPLPRIQAGKHIEWVIPLDEVNIEITLKNLGISDLVKRWCDLMREGDAQTPISASTTQETPPAPVSRWPWGNHHTELLGHLEAAAREFWSTYDHTKPRTAPKNEVVSNWLRARGVSKTNSEAMASILRLDGLPTGPRK